MAQQTAADTEKSYNEIKDEMLTDKGAERSSLDIDTDGHALEGMDTERNAPIEAVAKSAVERYDRIEAFYREYISNAHTACIQRAKYELREAGIDDVNYNDVREVLERATEEVGYEPAIVIKRNENPEDWSLKIEDNGIGITSQTAYAIRDIGLSGWHDDETTNGQFGIGTLSGFLPVDHYGEFDMYTWSVISDENYRARWKLTDLDKLPGERDSYGTTFEFPYFTDEAQEIDDYEAVREYAEGMIVPVIYEHYDENGEQDGTLSDDWGASYIEDRYADDSPIITYEDDFAKVVWSPDDPEGWSTNIKTWCGYQPINRNDAGIGKNSYSMPSAFDVRVKVENGPIVSVPDDADSDLIGKVPVSKNKYEHLDDDAKDEHVERSAVPDDAIVAPEPTDDRDRFESKHVDDFMRYYADRLQAQLKSEVSDIIESLDGLEDLPDLDDYERRMLLTGIDEYIDVYKKNDAERVQDEIETEFGTRPNKVLASNIGVVKSEFGDSVSDDFAMAVGRMKQTRLGTVDDEDSFGETVSEMTDDVELAPRGASNVSKTSYRNEMPVWKVVDKAGDEGDVYMAKTLTCRRKIELVWELHEDNQVVQVDSYSRWADVFGWDKIKDLPNRNFDESFEDHDFDDSWLDEWDPGHGDSGGSGGSGNDLDGLGFDHERAKQKQVTVRYDSGYGSYDEIQGEDLFEVLDNGDTFPINYNNFDTLLLYKQTDGFTTDAGSNVASKERGVAYAVVPNYVYDYLTEAENAMTKGEYVQREKNRTVEFDWTADSSRQDDAVADLDEQDLIIKANDQLLEPIRERGLMDEFVDSVEQQMEAAGVDNVRSITFEQSLDEYKPVLHKYGVIGPGCSDDDRPSLLKVSTPGFGSGDSFGYGYYTAGTLGVERTFFDCVLPDLDRDAPEWEHFDPSMDDEDLIDALQDLEAAGGFVSTDDDSELPDYADHESLGIRSHHYWVKQTMDRFTEVTDYVEDVGGDDE